MAALLLGVCAAARGQDPPVAVGVSAGAMRFRSGASLQVLTGLVQLAPRPWLTLSAAPGLVRVVPPDSSAYAGFGNLPVSLGLAKRFDGGSSPSLGAAFELSLPTSSSDAIGTRKVGWALSLGAGFAPQPGSYLYVNTGRQFTPAQGILIRSVQTTSVGVDGVVDLNDRLSVTASFSADVARSDSIAPLTRVVGAGLSARLVGELRLVVDGGAGLGDQSPRWLLSAGLGTTFSGLSPVGLNNSVERNRKAFGQSNAKARGKGKKAP